jgi:hypothetical protein
MRIAVSGSVSLIPMQPIPMQPIPMHGKQRRTIQKEW